MNILFVGQTWAGSCARSFREALSRSTYFQVDDLAEDSVIGSASTPSLRLINRVIRPLQIEELKIRILRRIELSRPDVFMVYKGWPIHSDLLSVISQKGIRTVNIYPDFCPLSHGPKHAEAVGQYDLVISTKVFHPRIWNSAYGYENACVFLPQGFDPRLHLIEDPLPSPSYDVVMVSTYRQEYGDLITQLAGHSELSLVNVAVAGHGWETVKGRIPKNWSVHGPLHGRQYLRFLRSSKICIAPLNPPISINGRNYPGDVDTTRTYELPAAGCFYIHQHSDYISEQFGIDLPTFRNPSELATKIRYFLKNDDQRHLISQRMHKMTIEHHSLDSRVELLSDLLKNI